MQLDIGYYDDTLGQWEPLLEPVMEKEGVYRPWAFTVKVRPTVDITKPDKPSPPPPPSVNELLMPIVQLW